MIGSSMKAVQLKMSHQLFFERLEQSAYCKEFHEEKQTSLSSFFLLCYFIMRTSRYPARRTIREHEQMIQDKYHTINLQRVRAVNTKLMNGSRFRVNRAKQIQAKEYSDWMIEEENRRREKRLDSVKNRSCSGSRGQFHSNRSLNMNVRMERLRSIEAQNKGYRLRIQSKRPTINVSKLEKDWKDNQGVIKRMQSPYFYKDFTTPRTISNGSKYINQQQQGILTPIISKIIESQSSKIAVKIYEDDQGLIIFGHIDNSDVIKKIQISKEQVNSLIQIECKGDKAKIINLLKFAPKSSIMYIINPHCKKQEIYLSQDVSLHLLKKYLGLSTTNNTHQSERTTSSIRKSFI